MNYTKLSVTCLDSFHHIYTVHYLSLKSPKIKFTSNISSRWCHCWFSSWFIEAWIITSVKRCTLSTVKLMVFKWRKVLVFKWRKKGKCLFYILSTHKTGFQNVSWIWNAIRQIFKEEKGSKICSFTVLENIHSFIPCNYFILVRAAMDSESIPGTLGPRWKYTQVGTPIHHRVPCTHKSTHSFTINGNLWYPMHICMFLGLGGNQRTHRTEPGPGALGRLENTSIILIKEGAPSLILP